MRDEDTEKKNFSFSTAQKGHEILEGTINVNRVGPAQCSAVCLLASFVKRRQYIYKGVSVQYQSIRNCDHINNSLRFFVNGECFTRISCISSIMPDFSFQPEKKLSQFRALCMVMYISQSSKLPIETSFCWIDTKESHINNHYVVIKTSWLMSLSQHLLGTFISVSLQWNFPLHYCLLILLSPGLCLHTF